MRGENPDTLGFWANFRADFGNVRDVANWGWHFAVLRKRFDVRMIVGYVGP